MCREHGLCRAPPQAQFCLWSSRLPVARVTTLVVGADCRASEWRPRQSAPSRRCCRHDGAQIGTPNQSTKDSSAVTRDDCRLRSAHAGHRSPLMSFVSPRRNYVGEAPPRHGLLCALCQASTSLTKAHVPPRSAGNHGATVTRARPHIEDQVRRLEPPAEGGLWLRTLCQECNGLASKYDGAYGDFADALLPHVAGRPLMLPSINGVPPVAVAPGRVARSVLHAMVALAPSFNVVDRRFVLNLRKDGDDLRLPGGMRLRVALTSDRRARIASAYHLHRVLGSRQAYDALADD